MTTRREHATIREAAEHLQVSYFTVYNRVRAGIVPAERRRGVYLIRWSDIAAYEDERDEAALYDRRRAIRVASEL